MRQFLFTNTEFQRDNRGLYYTLDAMLFAGLLIVAVVLAINAAPTQGSQDVAADRAEAQLQTNAQDVLAVANSTGRLKETTLYWDDSASRWVDSGSSERYFKPPSDHPLETPLSKIFKQENIAYNIAVIYQTEDGSTETKRLYYQGTPGAHAVSAQYTTVLNDDTHLRGPDSDRTVSESSTFYAPDAFPESSKYNILQVRMIVWKL